MSLTVQDVLYAGIQKLKEAGIDSPHRDARRLMGVAIDREPQNVTLFQHDKMLPGAQLFFENMIAERLTRRPVSQITGMRKFYGRVFYINDDVLDPRPETETLIELALAGPFNRVLDLGTGSGAILHTLLGENPNATGIGTDLSEDALCVAEDNPLMEDFSDRASFVVSDWFAVVDGQFDLIVSNPPYIALDEMPGLAPELSFEPRMALTDEGDGLGAYRKIAAGVMDHLAPGGRVLLEIGPTQAGAVSALLASAGLENIQVHPDLDGRDRVVSAENSRIS